MENSHLVAIMRTFSAKEVRSLRKWLGSPVHNQRDDVVQLFEYLMAGAHLTEEKFLEKERVFSKVFNGEPFDDAKLRQSMHFLLKAIEEFLIYEELRGDEVRSRMALSSVYRKRKLDKAFQKTINSVETLQEKAPYRDEHYLRNEYLLQLEKYTFQEGKKRTAEMNLQEVSDALDTTFLADKLRQSCLMIAHQAVYKASYNIGLLEEVLEHVKRPELMKHPAIAIYYNGYMAFTHEGNSDYFQALRQEIQNNLHLFSHSEIRDIFLMAINYCIRKMNVGEATFVREAFELYRSGIEEGILIENGLVSRFTFLNVIRIALRLGEFNWVESFIPDYKQYLAPKFRDTIVHYSKAKLLFEKKDYAAAMELLAHVDYDDVLLTLNARLMLIKIFYETDEYDALDSLLESMRTYIHRKDLTSSYKSNYQNIIRYTKKLVRINPYDGSQKSKLKTEIIAANPLTEKSWLLEHLEKL
ncbi:MAG: hypothetical protein H6573_01230 [Lewinellaceae bacterium]|nr:hypothetical protein [Phaeodactylibacter sp.]MCB9346120.1 hypothetical protein [Lewinellaceae bacterium]